MLNSFTQYCYYKIKYLLDKTIDHRDPLCCDFEISIGNTCIYGKKRELICFIEKKYSLEEINVQMIHNFVKWQLFYKNKTAKEISLFDNWHMKVVLKADLKYPIIVTINKEGQITKILDGLHRIKKAYMLKKKTITAYKIPENDLLTLQG